MVREFMIGLSRCTNNDWDCKAKKWLLGFDSYFWLGTCEAPLLANLLSIDTKTHLSPDRPKTNCPWLPLKKPVIQSVIWRKPFSQRRLSPLSISPNLSLNARNLSQERTQKPISFEIPQYPLDKKIPGESLELPSALWVTNGWESSFQAINWRNFDFGFKRVLALK